MRKAAIIFLLLSGAFMAFGQGAGNQALSAKLEQYFAILEDEPAEVKAEECDALIEAARDSSLRQEIALKIYSHYKASTLMGDEAVAIHLTDKWFAPGIIPMASEADLFEAKFFAEVNRQSLLGMVAPRMELFSPEGERVTVPELSSPVPELSHTVPEPVEGTKGTKGAKGVEAPGPQPRYQVLYFFDTDCSKCKLETATLHSLLRDKDYPIDVYAIYVGTNEESWKQWRENSFVFESGQTRVFHFWDSDMEADLQVKYGVVQTPRMFLLDPEGIIVGRGLDTEALMQMLDILLGEDEYSYGSEASKILFDKLFSTYGPPVAAGDVMDVAGLLKARTLDLGDTLSFKQLEGDLLYYLASRRDEGLREGAAGFIDEYIFTRPEIWNTHDDSLMVVGMAEMLHGLLGKSPVGSKIPRMSLKGWNKFRRSGGYIFFHSEGCSICAAQMKTADSLGLRYFSVDMDSIEEESPKTAMKLLNAFDLSALPFVIEIGKGGVVRRRYVSLDEEVLFLDEKE